jgi:hypothetical protein
MPFSKISGVLMERGTPALVAEGPVWSQRRTRALSAVLIPMTGEVRVMEGTVGSMLWIC